MYVAKIDLGSANGAEISHSGMVTASTDRDAREQAKSQISEQYPKKDITDLEVLDFYS